MKTKRRKTFLLWISGIMLFIVGMLLVGYFYEPFAEAADAKAYPPPGRLVDVGGYRLHIDCKGTGSPTVIIEAGWGDWSTSWKKVQDNVAKDTRVCTYDRAGMGWSDFGPNPRNAKQFAKELHTLLQKTNIQSPYILAGHSLGGFTDRVYAHEYPNEISGIVLIESMTPKQFAASDMNAHNISTSQYASPLTLLARFGIVRALLNLTSIIENAPYEEKVKYAINAHPKFVQTYLDEGKGMPESAFQASLVKSFGDKPLIVLTRGLEDPDQKSWKSWQHELLALSKNSKQEIAQKSGHNIEIEQPDAAVNAINRMVIQVRLENRKSNIKDE